MVIFELHFKLVLFYQCFTLYPFKDMYIDSFNSYKQINWTNYQISKITMENFSYLLNEP